MRGFSMELIDLERKVFVFLTFLAWLLMSEDRTLSGNYTQRFCSYLSKLRLWEWPGGLSGLPRSTSQGVEPTSLQLLKPIPGLSKSPKSPKMAEWTLSALSGPSALPPATCSARFVSGINHPYLEPATPICEGSEKAERSRGRHTDRTNYRARIRWSDCGNQAGCLCLVGFCVPRANHSTSVLAFHLQSGDNTVPTFLRRVKMN